MDTVRYPAGATRFRVHLGDAKYPASRSATDVAGLSKYREWRELVQTLTTADDMVTTGAISTAEHKATWQHAYHRLGAFAQL